MTRSYWQIKNSGLIRKTLSPDLPAKCDIAVVGAGIVGTAAAYYLKSMGCGDVVVLEKEHAGYGASGRNAGFLLAGMAEPYSRLVVGMGRDSARLLMRSTIENHDLIAEAILSGKVSCDYQRPGAFHLAVSDFEKRELAESIELLNKDGFGGEFFDRNVIKSRIGFGDFEGAYYCPSDGSLDPFAFVNGLGRDLNLVEGFEVESIAKSGGQVKISGGGRSIMAEMAVLATNAYSPLVDNFFKDMIFPVRGQMLSTQAGLDNPLGRTTYYANFGYDYFRSTPENAVLMGGLRNRFIENEVGYADELNPDLQAGLEGYVRDSMGIENFAVTCRWSGIMGNTVDGLPLVGALPHNGAVLAAVGYNGHGFGLGMIVARDVARALMTGETSVSSKTLYDQKIF